MTAANIQIVTAYEQLGLLPEQIAQEYDLDIESIKATLMQFSSAYRKAAKQDDQLNFSENELVAANQVIAQIMQYAEDDNLRLRAARYIRDDKKGRLDATQMRGLNINVLQFNMTLQKARERIAKAKNTDIVLEAHETKLLEEASKRTV